jgi:hypothetical protein
MNTVLAGTEDERRSGRKRSVTVVGLILVVVAALYLWAGATLASMLDSVEETEAVMFESFDLVEAIDFSANIPRLDLIARVSRFYGALEADLAVAADAIEDTTVLPLWPKTKEARGDYLAHVAAWDAQFERIGNDPETIGDSSPDINSTFTLACDALRDAVPIIDIFGSGVRVEAVCEQ